MSVLRVATDTTVIPIDPKQREIQKLEDELQEIGFYFENLNFHALGPSSCEEREVIAGFACTTLAIWRDGERYCLRAEILQIDQNQNSWHYGYGCELHQNQ